MGGFSGEGALIRCLVASVLLITIFAGSHVAGFDPAGLRPFSLGAICLGNIMYFVALLIQCSPWQAGSGATFWAWQCLMLLSLLVALVVGSVYSMPSMRNVASTFLVLWVMDKELE